MDNTQLKEWFYRLGREEEKDEAFLDLYEELKRPVFTLLCRMAPSRETAEDLLQEVFLRLYTSPPQASVKEPRAWVFRMARNLAIDALRKAGRESSAEWSEETLPGEEDRNLSSERLDMEAALLRLPRREKEILLLHVNGGLSFRETAQVLGESLPAIYRGYRKGLKLLRDLLNGGAI